MKTTAWIHERPNPDILDPDCWTNGVPEEGDKVMVLGHETECFPPEGCKNTKALEKLTLDTFIMRGGGLNMPMPHVPISRLMTLTPAPTPSSVPRT